MDHQELIVVNGAEVLARPDDHGAYWQRIRFVQPFSDPSITPLTKYFCRNG